MVSGLRPAAVLGWASGLLSGLRPVWGVSATLFRFSPGFNVIGPLNRMKIPQTFPNNQQFLKVLNAAGFNPICPVCTVTP
jgi:hypothetical protein